MSFILNPKIIFFLCFINIFNGYSQNVNIIKGVEYTAKKSEGTFSNILYVDEDFIYENRISNEGEGHNPVIHKVNKKTFEIIASTEYEYDQSNRDLVDETEIQTSIVNDYIFAFTRKFNVKESIVYLLFRRFDANTGKEIGTQQSVLNIECSKVMSSHIKFYVEFSDDKSKMMIGSNTSKVITIHDTKTLNKLGVINLSLKTGVIHSDFKIDNMGNLVYLDIENHILSLIQLSLNSQNPISLKLLEGVNGLKNSHIEITGKNIIVSGLTSQLEVFCISVDLLNNKILFNTSKTFTNEIMKMLNYSFDSKDGAINKFYSFENIIINKESIYIIQSQSYSTISINSSSGRETITKNEDELIITKFKLTGEYEWMKLIPKSNSGKTSGFNFMFAKNNDLHLFYLQHPKDNLEEKVEDYDYLKTGSTSGLGGCSLVHTTIDLNGKVKRKSLFINKGWCYKPISKNIIDEKENTIAIKMILGKYERYDKLVIE